jgi:hypothetical protein
VPTCSPRHRRHGAPRSTTEPAPAPPAPDAHFWRSGGRCGSPTLRRRPG